MLTNIDINGYKSCRFISVDLYFVEHLNVLHVDNKQVVLKLILRDLLGLFTIVEINVSHYET